MPYSKQVKVTSVTEMRRPASYAGEVFAEMEPNTYNVEFAVPASPTIETLKGDRMALTMSRVVEIDYPELYVQIVRQCVPFQMLQGRSVELAALICSANFSPANEVDVAIDSCMAQGRDYNLCYGDAIANPSSPKESILHRVSMLWPYGLERCSLSPDCPVGYRYPATVTEHKLRGWFIEGEGVDPCVVEEGEEPVLEGDKCGKTHPLVVFQQGQGFSANADWGGGVLKPASHRKSAYELAKKGYDVLLFDYLGTGYSEGYNDYQDFTQGGVPHQIYKTVLQPDPIQTFVPVMKLTGETITDPVDSGNVVNVFWALKHLKEGTATVYNPTLAHSAGVTGVSLIGADTPVILAGMSHGANSVMETMKLYVGGSSMGKVPPMDYAQFNLRGVIDEAGMNSMRYSRDRQNYLPAQAMRHRFGHTINYSDSETLESMDKFPAYLGVTAVHDGANPLESDVEAYNRVRGVKKLVPLFGEHPQILLGENFERLIQAEHLFIKKAVRNAAPLGTTEPQTTLEQEVCKAPWLDLTDPAYYIY